MNRPGRWSFCCCLLLVSTRLGFAQSVPPAPPLSPDEALKTFRVAPGYRLEPVAAEPMVQNPISFEFDPDGRIWVVEYQGYMRDIKGTSEGDPICRVVVLEDTDGDGRA